MPALGTAIEHESGRRQRGSDLTLLHQPQTGLNACSQERVRCAAHTQAACCSRIENGAPKLAGDGQRLFRVHVLAGREGRQVDLGMSAGDGQVDHQLDPGIGEELVGGADAGHAELRGPLLSRRQNLIGACDHLDLRRGVEVGQVGLADRSATDDSHAYWIVHSRLARMTG